ncbi:MAG: DUF5320 domain-containing protein [Candidatus Diapherotrites archaeon]|nr:DUF5320 domain-containing protein [Candidatus Diapherotrites archaeon]
MPYGDGTGPMGHGPRTGRGLGNCPGFSSVAFGMGFGRGMGRGRRFLGFAPARQVELTKDQQVSILEEEKKVMEAELEELEAARQGIAKKLKELSE